MVGRRALVHLVSAGRGENNGEVHIPVAILVQHVVSSHACRFYKEFVKSAEALQIVFFKEKAIMV